MTLEWLYHYVLKPTVVGLLSMIGVWLVVVFFIWVADQWKVSLFDIPLPKPPEKLRKAIVAVLWLALWWFIGLAMLAGCES